MNKITTYLLFDGTCKNAMEFYKSVFGGDLTETTVGESPMAQAFPPELHGHLVHARLTSDSVDIPASDWLAQNETPERGNMNCMYVSGGPPEEILDIFEKLSVDAMVTDPLTEQPFGWYGRLIDAYGVIWMFHSDKN